MHFMKNNMALNLSPPPFGHFWSDTQVEPVENGGDLDLSDQAVAQQIETAVASFLAGEDVDEEQTPREEVENAQEEFGKLEVVSVWLPVALGIVAEANCFLSKLLLQI